ncbi:MAG: hypothetical protein ACRCV9_15815 [Burkholderiaceae bacterium]
MERFILRYCGSRKASTASVATRAEKLRAGGARVIDSTPTMLLFDADPAFAHAVAGRLSAWELVRESFTPRPKPHRPQLRKAPASAE